MNFDLSEDQHTIKRTARELLSARFKPEEVRRLAFEDPRGWTDAQWAEMEQLGWPELAEQDLDPTNPLGTVELAVVAEELGYALAPTPLQSTWAAGLLLAAGGQSARLAGRRGTVAVWEGSGAGEWIAVPEAGSADLLVTRDGSVFEDFAAEPVEGLDPTRRLFAVTVRGDGEPLSGDLPRAWDQILVMNAAESVGVAERAMHMAVAYAKERKQFGRAIGTYQAVSHACAQMLLEVEGARSVVYWAAWALDHEPETGALAAACAKAYASDAGVRVTRSAMQVHGGIGFTWEHDLHLLLKRAEANAHAYGDARSMRERVAELTL
jgi:alkylation response protein AidB-like acyl-CoA dehydrogenase